MRCIPARGRQAELGAWLVAILLTALTSATLAQQSLPGALPNRILELDGSGAYVELPVAAFQNLGEATVEAWVRWDQWDSFSQWFAYGAADPWRATGVNHFGGSPLLQYFVYPGAREDLRVITVQAAGLRGNWHHMAAVSGNAGMRLFVDGTTMGEDAYSGSFADVGPATHAFLGRSSWASNAYFRGALDEVRLWSVARSVDAIRADMGRALSGGEPDLVARWSFDAGDGRDGTGHGHDGVLRGDARCVAAPYPGTELRARAALVRGEVRDASGAAVAHARVRLNSEAGHTVQAGSDGAGDFSVAVVDPGTYTVEVLSEAVRLPSREVHVAPGAVLTLDLQPPPPHLVARWSADGDASDDIGGHHGSRSGDVSFAPGVEGQAFQFGADGGLVRVPHAPALSPAGSFSLSAWIFPETDRCMAVLALWGDYGEWSNQRAYYLEVTPGRRLDFSLSDSANQEDAAYHHLITRPNAVPLKAWSLVTAVWDADTGERRLYANGLLVGRRADAAGSIAPSAADLAIGTVLHSPTVTECGFAGRIDEAALYGVALSNEDIARLYSARAQARWPGEGNVSDVTRSGHDGVAVGQVGYSAGVVGQAFVFDGNGGYVEFDPRIGNYGAEDFSVELWLRQESEGPAAGPILAKGDTAGLELSLDGAGRVVATLAGRRDALRMVAATPLASGDWHHLVLVREGRQARLFLDGELDASATAEDLVELQTPAPLLLGGLPQAGSFSGQIDEVALHRRPLAADEIHATYDRVLGAWRWRVWRTRLQAWGSAAVGLLALLMGGRFASNRRLRRRERERLDRAEQARRVADAANQAKSAFLANMSHDIRTPMTAIMGHAQMLRDDPSLGEEQRRRSVAAICDHGGILLGLINDILDLSKSDAGHMELQSADFDLAQLVDGLQTLFEVRCRQRGLQLQVECESEAGMVHGDEGKLRQVLVNLLDNAVKFTDEGEVALRLSGRDGEYTFEVRDTGPGIAPEQRGAVLQPFQQGASGLARGGTGLGLAIAQRYVTLMGGALRIDPAPGGGTLFAFCIPLVRTGPAPARTAGTEGIAAFAGQALPPDLRSRLRQAVQMHNITEAKRCLEDLQQLGDREAELAQMLSGAVNRFELAPVLEALEVTVDG